MSEAALNLSGLWHGRYAYPRTQPPVPFTATLTEIDGWLSGSIEEKSTRAGSTLVPSLQGRRTGLSVTWLKLYEGAPPHYDAVHYEGTVSADAMEISGRWIIHGSWSGTFLMIRPKGTGAKTSVKATERA